MPSFFFLLTSSLDVLQPQPFTVAVLMILDVGRLQPRADLVVRKERGTLLVVEEAAGALERRAGCELCACEDELTREP
jgi:hypothetical protein